MDRWLKASATCQTNQPKIVFQQCKYFNNKHFYMFINSIASGLKKKVKTKVNKAIISTTNAFFMHHFTFL